jgi:hypothetical protein
MKNILFYLVIVFASGNLFGQGVQFSSTDTSLEIAFKRAKQMALSYKGKPGDPVGEWYESALPPRSAFCMRDVSHQAIGGEILGLSKGNKNMLSLFAKNITANKDWCSYWEMNRLGKPAPEDYRNDKEFWYNLNANFDVLNACWRLYLWTGDGQYINGKEFANFHEKSVTDFVESWVLQADSLLTRPTHPNAPIPFNDKDAFHRCRGLPSYSEGVPNIKMGIDLVAALYRGFLSYAAILEKNNRKAEAALYTQKATAYQENIDALWWDKDAGLYNTFYSHSNQFGRDEGETFLLWFDGLKDSTRKQKTLQHLMSNNWNVENQSYFPVIMYQNGYWDKGDEYMQHLTNPATARREYPEVSFGVVEGFVQGLMGVAPDARFSRVSTLYRNKNEVSSTISNLPVLGTLLSVTHQSGKQSAVRNTGKKAVLWRACFAGDYNHVLVNGKPAKVAKETNWLGNIISSTDVPVGAGKTVTVWVN